LDDFCTNDISSLRDTHQTCTYVSSITQFRHSTTLGTNIGWHNPWGQKALRSRSWSKWPILWKTHDICV